MANGESVEREVAGSFSEAQLEAITGVVQRLLNKAHSERRSGKSSGPTSDECGAADKSSDTTPSGPGCVCPANAHSLSSSGLGGKGASRLVVTSLGPTIQHLLQAGIAPSTQRAHMAGKKKYLMFCQKTGAAPLPATEQKLIEFVAFAVTSSFYLTHHI